ncbi:MAG TPA: AAA family ATPase [Kofleriaceae bacterium]|nr:AAA family ATPase [Kofleriaceae bacterium]
MALDALADEVEALFQGARQVARRAGHARVDAAHVLLAALEPPPAALRAALAAARVDLVLLRDRLERRLAELPRDLTGDQAVEDAVELADAIRPLLRTAGERAARRDRGPVRAVDVIDALLAAPALAEAVHETGADIAALRQALDGPPAAGAATARLAEYTVDLTAVARAGQLDPVIGREPEIRQLVHVLSRRRKNNPLLVGEAGVGKTAIVEGLAQRIAAGHVPEHLAGCAVCSLDMGRLLAGTRFRGELEERIKGLLDDVARTGRVILFIDEIHMLVGAGGEQGGSDAANLIKPALARGELRCIGATTTAEHRRRIERDAALSRRFQLIAVDEPEPALATTILRGLKRTFETHHGVRITDASLHAAVRLASRHLPDRQLPDKAVDLIDQAAAGLRSELASRPEALEVLHDRILGLELEAEALDGADPERAAAARAELARLREQLRAGSATWLSARAVALDRARLDRELADARARMADAVRERRYDDVAELQHQRIPELEAQLAGLPAPAPGAPTACVDEPLIAQVVSRMTGIPVAKLVGDEARRLLDMERLLGARVVGQPEAIERVSRAVRRARAQLRDPRRPIGSFLLAGPTGVGKTELCKALADFLFGDERALVRIDMSEYMEKHAVSRLVGAPPGYVGYDEGGELTNQVRRRPYCVILLDEVEKAHADVFHLLLQVLDDGHLTDAAGRRVDFKHTLIMMTSNLGTAPPAAGAPWVMPGGDARDRVLRAVRGHFRPELLNRLDDIIVFHGLDRAALVPIVGLHVAALRALMAEQHIGLEVSPAAAELLADQGYQPEYGARPLRRRIQEAVQDPIAELIIRGELSAGGCVVVDAERGALRIRPVAPPDPT